MSPSSMASSTPVMVTVCAALQLEIAKINSVGLTVPSLLSLLVSVTVTALVGSEVSTTVKVAVAPASLVVKPLMG
jgi:hypothetical protein